MTGSNCENCQDSIWVQDANQYLLRHNGQSNALTLTINFLLNNGHCGINNRITMGSILTLLRRNNINMTREEYQNLILTELKREGIVAALVYPGPMGGVFIPCEESEIRQVCEQMFSRIISELRNLEELTASTDLNSIIITIKNLCELCKR